MQAFISSSSNPGGQPQGEGDHLFQTPKLDSTVGQYSAARSQGRGIWDWLQPGKDRRHEIRTLGQVSACSRPHI